MLNEEIPGTPFTKEVIEAKKQLIDGDPNFMT